jgi:hypothetical protein
MQLKTLLNKLGFNSDHTRPDSIGSNFPRVTLDSQLNNRRPFILTIKHDRRIASCRSNHAVVGYGIDGNFLVCIDPKYPRLNCTPDTLKFLYYGASRSTVPSVCRFFYNINPKISTIAIPMLVSVRSKSPNIVPKPNFQSENIEENHLFEGEIKDKISNSKLKELSNSKDYIAIPVKYISYHSIVTGDTNNIFVNVKAVDLIYTKYPFTVTTLQKSCFKWVPTVIRKFKQDLTINSKLDSNRVYLNLKIVDEKIKKEFPNLKTYDAIIKYPDLGYDFLEFTDKNKKFLTPLFDYNDLKIGDKPVKAGQVISEDVLITVVRKVTIKEYDSNNPPPPPLKGEIKKSK